MNNQKIMAIIAIVIVIPVSIFIIWNSNKINPESIIESDKPIVITSFFPLYEFSKQVGQDNVNVQLLVPPGIEPHDWEPTIKDIDKMKKSSLVVINGIGFETWVEDILSISSAKINVVDTSHGIDFKEFEDIQKANRSSDPHIWLNPIMAKIQVINIKNALVSIDPKNESYYTANAEDYLSKLDSLDTKIKSELKSCKKDFVTFHSAFSHFADQYGLNQHSIVSSSPNAEPTPQTLEKIITLAKQLNIKVIFAEEKINPRISEVIANEIGGKVLVLSTMEIFESNVGYIDKMEKNLEHFKEALCE